MILAQMPGVGALTFQHWTIIEPLTDFVAAARAATADDPRFAVVQGYLEGEVATLRAMQGFGAGYDAVVLSGLLHETSDPTALLAAAVALTAPGGHVLASVPNAGSFHRLLAVEAGLIDRSDRLSPRDVTLGHPIVFDRAGFQALMEASGLMDLTFDGYLFKPFTHPQMEAVLALPGPDLVEGLIRLGRLFPDQAAEICVTGRKPAV
jgi:SAM-dependent methyltransferase